MTWLNIFMTFILAVKRRIDEEVQGRVALDKWAEKLEGYCCSSGIIYWYFQLECRSEDGQKQM